MNVDEFFPKDDGLGIWRTLTKSWDVETDPEEKFAANRVRIVPGAAGDGTLPACVP